MFLPDSSSLICERANHSPKLFLLDELTEGIQPHIIKQAGEVIKELRNAGNTGIISVEQYFDLADNI